MKKLIIILISIPVLLFSQDNKTSSKKSINISLLNVAKYSNKFKLKNIDFNRKIDFAGRGVQLEVQMIIYNLTDAPIDLYVFVIATNEIFEKRHDSFKKILTKQQKLKMFIPYPNEIKNFQYPETDKKGKTIKDESGNVIMQLLKMPLNYKKGVNKYTGKAYKLKNRLVIRTMHLSKYRKNYVYFNNVTVVIFDKDGSLAFKQLYYFKGFRK